MVFWVIQLKNSVFGISLRMATHIVLLLNLICAFYTLIKTLDSPVKDNEFEETIINTVLFGLLPCIFGLYGIIENEMNNLWLYVILTLYGMFHLILSFLVQMIFELPNLHKSNIVTQAILINSYLPGRHADIPAVLIFIVGVRCFLKWFSAVVVYSYYCCNTNKNQGIKLENIPRTELKSTPNTAPQRTQAFQSTAHVNHYPNNRAYANAEALYSKVFFNNSTIKK